MEKKNSLRHVKAATQKSTSIRAKKVPSKHSVGNNGGDVVNQSHVSLLNERIRQLEQNLETQTQKRKQLEDENHALQTESKQTERELQLVATNLHVKLDGYAAKIADLESQIKKLNDDHSEKLLKEKKRYEAEAAESKSTQEEMQSTIEGLRLQLNDLDEFQQNKNLLEKERENFEIKYNDTIQEYEEQLGRMHLRAYKLEEKNQTLEQQLAEIESFSNEGNNKDTPSQLLKENKRLESVIRCQKTKIDSLNKIVQKKDEDLKNSISDVAVSKIVEQEAAVVCANEANRAAKAEARIEELTSEVNTLQHSKEVDTVEIQGLKVRLKELKKSERDLKRLLSHSERELRHAYGEIKSLLEARSEVQSFLLASIRCVRQHIDTERQLVLEQGKSKPKRIRNLNVRALQSHEAHPSVKTVNCDSSSIHTNRSESIASAAIRMARRLNCSGGKLEDIAELSWDEREAVLRILLAQINSNCEITKALNAFTDEINIIYSNERAGKPLRLTSGSPTISLKHESEELKVDSDKQIVEERVN